MSAARKIIKNIFSLSMAEVATKGIQLLTATYLTRTILTDGFGIIGFSNAITIYFLVIVSLGFNVIGVREIAKDKSSIKKYVDAIISIRLLLAAVSFAILGIIVLYLNKPLIVKYTILAAGFNFFAQAFLLDWLYQGIEKMEIQAIRQVITGLLTLVGTVLLVHSPEDVFIAMAVTVGSLILNSAWMLAYYVRLYGGIHFHYDKELWKVLMKSSIPIGLTNLIIANYNYLNTLLLGLFRNDHETGIYTAAYKILVVAILPSTVVQNAFFPVLSRAEEKEDRIKIMKKYSALMFLIAVIISTVIFAHAKYFSVLLFGPKFVETGYVLQILMITAIFMYINVSFSAPLMAWNKEKQVMYAIGIGGIVSTIFNFLLIPHYGLTGAAIVTIVSEIAVMCGLAYINYKTIGKFFFPDLIKFFIYAAVSSAGGWYLTLLGINAIIASIISFLLFIGINLIFKSFTIAELKGYFQK